MAPALSRHPSSYLRRTGALAAAAAAGLCPRAGPHRIVPPRFFVPAGATQGALPFRGMSEEAIYLAKRFTGATLLERYVEWVGAGDGAGDSAGGGDSGAAAAAPVSSRGKAQRPGVSKKQRRKAERIGRR